MREVCEVCRPEKVRCMKWVDQRVRCVDQKESEVCEVGLDQRERCVQTLAMMTSFLRIFMA